MDLKRTWRRFSAWAKGRLAAVKQSLPGRVYERYAAAGGPMMATVIAYAGFFSMFPLILAIIAILGFVLRTPSLLASARDAIFGAFPPQVSGEIVDAVEGASRAASVFGVVAVLGLLWGGSALFGAVDEALARTYGVPARPFLRQKLIGAAMIFLFAALIVLSILASGAAQVALQLAERLPLATAPILAPLAAAASWGISFGLAVLLFVVIYWVYPENHKRPHGMWPGALLAALLFVLLEQIFPLYLRYAGDFNRFGAVFGFFFLLLTWLQLVAQVLVLGAALNAELATAPRRGSQS